MHVRLLLLLHGVIGSKYEEIVIWIRPPTPFTSWSHIHVCGCASVCVCVAVSFKTRKRVRLSLHYLLLDMNECMRARLRVSLSYYGEYFDLSSSAL